MHILHSLFTNAMGGTERHVADLANAQVAAGHQVSILIRGNRAARGKKDLFQSWLSNGISLHSLPNNWLFLRWPLLPIWLKVYALSPDIIHTHHGRDSRYLAKVSGDIPVIASLHMRYRKKDYKRHNGLICVSNWQLKTVPAEIRDRTVLIPNWVEPYHLADATAPQILRSSLGLKQDDILLGSVGRLSPEKGTHDLVEAFLTADLANTHLAIYGDGELYEALKIQIADHPRIHLLGYEKDIRQCYYAFDVFVLPSREESFGLVLLEAMDAGCPIITTRTDGALDLLGDNPHVTMAEISSPISLEHAIKTTLAKPLERIDYPELSMHRLAPANAAILKFYQRFL